MKSRHTALGRRPAPETNVPRPDAGRRLPRHSAKRYVRMGLLAVFVAAIAASFFPSSAATSVRRAMRALGAAQAPAAQTPPESGRDASHVVRSSAAGALLEPVLPAAETIDTYAADCVTPKSTFALGETVCAKLSGAPAGVRRFDWANTYPIVVRQSTAVTTDPQTDTFTIPTAQTSNVLGRTIDNRGTWRVNSTSTIDGTVYASAFFTVSDPNNPVAELSLSNVVRIGATKVAAGGNVSFQVLVRNQGPDAAQNVTLTNDSPAATTLVSVAQDAGAGFSCSGPTAGGTGLTTCTAASLPAGASATLTLTYKVDAGATNGTAISDTAQVTSQTAEQNTDDDAMTASTVVNTPPCVITPPADITQNNDIDPQTNRALGGATVNYADPQTTAACDTANHPVSCVPASGSFFPVGNNIATCSNDLGDSASFTVNIIDTEAPVFTSCPGNITANESAPGSGAVVTYNATATDNSGQVTVACDHDSGSTFGAGTTHVTCTASDAAGHSANCQFDVTVNGSTQMTCSLSCPQDISVYAAPGESSAPVTYANPSTTGNCGTVTYSLPSGSFFPVGTTTVTATAKDSGGNTLDSCSFTVTVKAPDTTPPVFAACPAGVTVPADGGGCSASVTLTPPQATDDQSTPTVNGTRSDGLPLSAPYAGNVVVTWTATDAAGNIATCEQPVTVTETTPPTISGLAPQTVYVDDSCAAIVPDFVSGLNIADNCTSRANLEVTQSPAASTSIGPGAQTVQVTVKDLSGNVTTATTTLNVVDNKPPVITLNQPQSNPMTVECHTSLTDPGASATDNCTATVTTNSNVNVNVPGTYTITYSASDGTNTVTATRTVNVVDTQPPALTLNGPAAMTVECHTGFTDPGATASDGCAGDLTGAIQVTGSVNPNATGTYTLTYTVSDGQGHTATATRTVTVVDTTPPVISCPADIVAMLPLNSTAVSMPVNFAVSASDGCGSATVTTSAPSGASFPVGTTVVTATATDEHGNQSSCSFKVTVLYDFTGFFQPVSNLPTVNAVKAGQAVPVKFSLSGNKGLSIFAAGSPASAAYTCNDSDPSVDVNDTVAATGNSLSYDASSDQYNFVWKTDKSWVGTCRQLVLVLNDGSIHRANFKFK